MSLSVHLFGWLKLGSIGSTEKRWPDFLPAGMGVVISHIIGPWHHFGCVGGGSQITPQQLQRVTIYLAFVFTIPCMCSSP